VTTGSGGRWTFIMSGRTQYFIGPFHTSLVMATPTSGNYTPDQDKCNLGDQKGEGDLRPAEFVPARGCGAACGVGAERRPTVGAPFVRGSWHCRPGQVPGLLETVLGPVIRAYDGRCSLNTTGKQKQKQTNREPVKRRVTAPTASSQIP
jgi:hypothetical protein